MNVYKSLTDLKIFLSTKTTQQLLDEFYWKTNVLRWEFVDKYHEYEEYNWSYREEFFSILKEIIDTREYIPSAWEINTLRKLMSKYKIDIENAKKMFYTRSYVLDKNLNKLIKGDIIKFIVPKKLTISQFIKSPFKDERMGNILNIVSFCQIIVFSDGEYNVHVDNIIGRI